MFTTYYIQQTTYSILHTTNNIQHITYIIQHKTYNTQHTTHNVQHTTRNILPTTHNILHSIQHTVHAAYNIQHTTYLGALLLFHRILSIHLQTQQVVFNNFSICTTVQKNIRLFMFWLETWNRSCKPWLKNRKYLLSKTRVIKKEPGSIYPEQHPGDFVEKVFTRQSSNMAARALISAVQSG